MHNLNFSVFTDDNETTVSDIGTFSVENEDQVVGMMNNAAEIAQNWLKLYILNYDLSLFFFIVITYFFSVANCVTIQNKCEVLKEMDLKVLNYLFFHLGKSFFVFVYDHPIMIIISYHLYFFEISSKTHFIC